MPYQKTYEIFKPPYLFTADGSPATRPQIKSAETDSNLVYSEAFTIKLLSPAPEQIARVALVRLGAMTHSFDQETRYVPLNYTISGPDTLKAAAPSHGYEAPPGYYMLFVLSNGDRAGILFPSVAKIVRLGLGVGT